jgi:hypothetical protein
MLNLWINSEPIVLDPDGCKSLLGLLAHADTRMISCALDQVKMRSKQKSYRKPGFRFVRHGYIHAVPQDRLAALKAASEEAAAGKDVEFVVGIRVLEVHPGNTRIERL